MATTTTVRSRSLTLNRLTHAENQGTNCSATLADGHTEYWGSDYVYDAWGNLLQKNTTKCSAEPLTAAAATNNQLIGYSYDAAGNLLGDGLGHTFTYDAGGMMRTSANSVTGTLTYLYDSEGNRFQKWQNGAATATYWHGLGGEVLSEGDVNGNITADYVFFGGRRVARVDLPSGAVHYYLSDHLGSTSMVVSSSGGIENESEYYPWGGELQFSAAADNHYKFTGKERDSESGLDYFGARYYGSTLGRFMTPDWATRPSPVPYAEFGDPQSLNLYSYVRNIPTTRVDGDGHCPQCEQAVRDAASWIAERIAADGFMGAQQNSVTGTNKGFGQFGIDTANSAIQLAMPGTRLHIPTPKFLRPSNPTQAGFAKAARIGAHVTVAAASVVAPIAAASGAVGAVESGGVAVTHFTSDAGVAAITEGGGILRGGTFVTTPGEIPAGATSSQVEGLLEVGSGKGANSITFEGPESNLAVPKNGPTTSGGAQQFQLKEPVKIDPSKFKKTDGGG